MENITPDEEAQLVTMLGGKRGDRLVADAEGNYSIQPGTNSFAMSAEPTDPVQARGLAISQEEQKLNMLNEPNATLRRQARSSELGETQYHPLQSAGYGAASATLPTIASIGAGILPSIATRAVTSNPWAMMGAGIAGIPLGIAASHYTSKAQEEYLDPSIQAKINLAAQQNPRAFKVGTVAPSLAAFGTSTAPLQSAGRIGRDVVSALAARGPLATGTGAMLGNVGRQAAASGDVANVLGGAVGAAIPAGMAYHEYSKTGELSPFDVGVDVAAGLFLNKSRKAFASTVNKLSRGPIMSTEGFIPRAGDELRAGLDMPALEMPSVEPDIPLQASRVIDNPEADTLAKQMAAGKEAEISRQQAADKAAEKAANAQLKEQAKAEKAEMDQLVKQARDEEKLAKQVEAGKIKEQKLKLKEQAKMGQQKLDFEKQYNETKAKSTVDTEAELLVDEMTKSGGDVTELALKLPKELSDRVIKVLDKRGQYSLGDNPLPGERVAEQLTPTESSQLQNKLGTVLSKQGVKVDAYEGGRYRTADDPTLRSGKTTTSENAVEFATASPDTAPHEAIHNAVSQLSPEAQTRFMQRVSENADYQRAKQRRPDLTPSEFIAEEGSVALARQIKDKDFGLFRDIANIWRNVTGSKDIYDSMRSLGNVLAMGASKEGGSFNLNVRAATPRDVGPAGTYRRYPEMEISTPSEPSESAPSPKSDELKGGETTIAPTEVDSPLPDVQYSKLDSTVNQIEDPDHRFAVTAAFNDASRLAGEYGADLNKIAGKMRDAGIDVKQLVDAYRAGKPLTTPEAQPYYAEIKRIANEVNAGGVARMINIKDGYVPEVFSRDVTEVFRRSTETPEAKAVINALATHWKDRDAAEAFAKHVHVNRTTNLDADFGPARKMAGLGLPESATANGKVIPIRENDVVRALDSYARRLAKDVSWYRNVESKYGRDISSPGMQEARKAYRGRHMDDTAQMVQQGVRLTSKMATGTATAVRNLLANPVQQAMYGGKDFPIKLVKSWVETARAYPRLRRRAIKQNVLRAGANQPEFDPNVDNPVAHGVKVFTDAWRLLDLSAAGEDISRVQNMAFGEIAAVDYINRARKGDKHAIAAMRKFGVDPADPQAMEKLSAVIARRVEGTYDPTGLPGFMHDNVLGDLLSIHKWGYEKMLRFKEDAIQPALKGDLAPLLYAIAAAAGITIPAIEELNEFLRGRRGQASLKEIEAAEKVTGEKNLRAYLSWFTDKLVTAGLGGYGANLANVGAALAEGRVDIQPIFIPLQEEGGAIKKLVADTVAAMGAGEPGIEVLKGFTEEALKIMFQAASPIIKQLDKAEATHGSDLRDKAVYEKLSTGVTAPVVESNKLIGRREKAFKQSVNDPNITPEQQADMLGTLIEGYVKEYGNDPIEIQKKIKALKTGGDRSFPTAIFGKGVSSIEAADAAKFIDYLYGAYGAKEAEAKIYRAAQRYARDEVRKELVPDVE